MNGAATADFDIAACTKAISALENELPRLLTDPDDPERVMARLVWARLSELELLRARLLASYPDDMLATG
jgi:hypothetical protein